MRRTQQAIRQAFIDLVLAHGFDAVTVEDIAERADIARPTFYAHFVDKEQLLATLFGEMTSELTDRLSRVDGAPPQLRLEIVRALYEHAERFRDLYRVCLRGAGNGRARAEYLELIADAAVTVFGERVRATGLTPKVPVPVAARVFAGAHVALLEEWLEHEPREAAADAARTQIAAVNYGLVWAIGMLPPEVESALPEIAAPASPEER